MSLSLSWHPAVRRSRFSACLRLRQLSMATRKPVKAEPWWAPGSVGGAVGGIGRSADAPGGRQGGAVGPSGSLSGGSVLPARVGRFPAAAGVVASGWGEKTDLICVLAPVLGLGRQQRAHHQ